MTDSIAAKRVKQAVGDVFRKFQYEGGAIDLRPDEAEDMWLDIKKAISAALPVTALTATQLDDSTAPDIGGNP